MRLLPALIIAAASAAPFAATKASTKSLWYQEPGIEALTEGLPIGNGRLGALINGQPKHERIVLNEDTLYSGSPYNPSNPDALEALPKIRELIFQNRHREAQELVQKSFMSIPLRQMSYQALCDLVIDQPDLGPYSDFYRSLDLETGVATVRFTSNGTTFTRESFASAPDNVLVFRFTANKPGKLHLNLRFSSPHNNTRQEIWADGFRIVGRNSESDGIPSGLRWETEARVKIDGGWRLTADSYLKIRDADSVTVMVSAATSYVDWKDVSGNPSERNQAALAQADDWSYAKLLERHTRDFERYFDRFDLTLESPKPELAQRPTDARIATYPQDRDPDLAALYLHFARYLLLSSSRPGSQPANLQGIWNDKLFAPWGSKYTININTEMNYWAASALQLPECIEPLADLLRDLSESGQTSAKELYGANGWTTHHNTDLWRATGPIDGVFWGMWQTGGAWLSLALWDRYLYSGDVEQLRQDYPILREVARFFTETLVVDPRTGYMVTCPSNSPENAHHAGVSIEAGPTMDNAILRDLFAAVSEASKILDTDEAFRTEVEKLSTKLPPLQIGAAGQLQEWQFDWDLQIPEPHHRHISHLYALHPSNQIAPLSTPELAKAARKTLELRGDDGTGWSLAWKINFWARLLEGDRSADLLAMLISPGRCYTNMFDAHPPFQIDGNFGGANGMVEMLLQSHLRDENGLPILDLLPALPTDWKAGSVKNLAARGGFSIDLDWKDGQLTRGVIHSPKGGACVVRSGSTMIQVTLTAGDSAILNANLSQQM